MLIPVTIVLTQDVSALEIYDFRGSDTPLYKGKGHTAGDEIGPGSVISDKCSPPGGTLEIRWIKKPPSKPVVWNDALVPVVEGMNKWP